MLRNQISVRTAGSAVACVHLSHLSAVERTRKCERKRKSWANSVRPIPISYTFVVSVHDDASKEGSLHRVNRIKKGTTATTTNNDSSLLSVLRAARDRFGICSFFYAIHWGTVSISTAKVRCTECRTLEYNWQHNLLNQSTNISMPLDQLDAERASLKRLFMVIIHAMMWFVWIFIDAPCNRLQFHIERISARTANEWGRKNKTIANMTN